MENNCGHTHVAGGDGGLCTLALGLLRDGCPRRAPGGGLGTLWLLAWPPDHFLAWTGPQPALCLHWPYLGSHLEYLPGSPSSPWSTEPRAKSHPFCFPGTSLVVQWLAKPPRSQCKGPGFDSWLGNEIPYATTKDPSYHSGDPVQLNK